MTDEQLCEVLDKIAETRLLIHKLGVELSAIERRIHEIWHRVTPATAPKPPKPHSFFTTDDL